MRGGASGNLRVFCRKEVSAFRYILFCFRFLLKKFFLNWRHFSLTLLVTEIFFQKIIIVNNR